MPRLEIELNDEDMARFEYKRYRLLGAHEAINVFLQADMHSFNDEALKKAFELHAETYRDFQVFLRNILESKGFTDIPFQHFGYDYKKGLLTVIC
jgi:hypothetical protein